jgi:hypothetical protein
MRTYIYGVKCFVALFVTSCKNKNLQQSQTLSRTTATLPKIQYGTDVTDYDGNTYSYYDNRYQTWLAENLKVTHYNNGDKIL